MIKLFLLTIIVGLASCYHQKHAHYKKYALSLKQLAHQRGKYYVPAYNSISDITQREIIIREYSGDSIGNKWNNNEYNYNQTLLIESIDKYKKFYIIADTPNYNSVILDIPPQTDSASIFGHIDALYVGSMIDTNLNNNPTLNKQLVMQVLDKCEVKEGNQLKGFNFSYILVKYEISEKGILPIEILDYKSDPENDNLTDAYQGTCFCQMKSDSFYAYLHQKLILSSKPLGIYPFKFKKYTKRKQN